MYELAQLDSLLHIISRTGAILVGGQAVNFWSERYQKEAEPWTSSRPFTSVDVDLLGNQTDARTCAEATGGELELPDDPAHTPNTAKVHCRHPDVDIDVLHTVNGLNTAEATQTAVSLRHGGIPLRVLHPVLCVESKTVNLITLDQSAEGRQDEKHLRLSIANCAEFLRELTQKRRAPTRLIRWAERLRTHASSQAGLEVQRKYRLQFLDCVPLEFWSQSTGPLRHWVQHESPRWRVEVEQKLHDLEDLGRWVQELKQRQRSPPSTT